MRRREFITGSAATVAESALSNRAGVLVQPGKPLNLLFITADDMNYSLPGFMGGQFNLTPSLDALAARSYRLVNNYASAPILPALSRSNDDR